MNKPRIFLGGHLFGYSLNEFETHNLFSAAYLNGVFGVDTSGSYSSGISEKFIGEWAASQGVGSEIRVISKLEVDHIWSSKSIHNLNSQLEASLIRLKCSSIDTVLLHHFVEDPKFLDSALKFFEGATNKKLVKNWGICNINSKQFSQVAKAMNSVGLKKVTLQNYCNWAKRKHNYWESFFKIANSQRIELEALSYGVYGRGVLVSLDSENNSQLNSGKSRSTLNEKIRQEKENPLIHDIIRAVDSFLPIAENKLDRFALSFTFNQNSGAIVGIRSSDQLNRAISCYAKPYSQKIIVEGLGRVNLKLKNLDINLGDPGLGL